MNATLVEEAANSPVAKKLISASVTNKDIISRITHFKSVVSEEKVNISLLLIGENTLLAEFITANLPDYKISWATNKADGLKKAVTLMPDLVIIDAGIPAINSYGCCEKIKADKRTNHIPVLLIIRGILYDAFADALASGADDYLFEPFPKEELYLRIKKLVTHQYHLQIALHKELSSHYILEKTIAFPSWLVDKELFFKKIHAVIEENLDNINFEVKDLAVQLFISKASLHRKLKAMSCPAPNIIITNYRLHRASQFLKEGYNSSETADKTGFSSAAYFSNRFHKLFNLTPSEYCRQQTAKRSE